MQFTNKKLFIISIITISLAVLLTNLWRFMPRSGNAERAVALYTEILKDTIIIGEDFNSLTTTLGYYPAKKVSENPLIAALMLRLLIDAGITNDTVVAINASGSFPGYTLAMLSACSILGAETYVIASIGSSSYGANIFGNTIADILLQDNVRHLGHTLLAITPGGTNDMGRSLDEDEIERIRILLIENNIPFMRPLNLEDAIDLRISLFSDFGSNILVNIGGSHASTASNLDLDLMAGVITQEQTGTFNDYGLVQHFINSDLPVIQILNLRLLFANYGLSFDEHGNIIGNTGFLFMD